MVKRLFTYTCLQVFFILSFALNGCNPSIPPTVEPRAKPEDRVVLKLKVAQAGLYRVSSEYLEEAGMLVDDPTHVKLTLGNQHVPVWVEESSNQFDLYFYGVPPESLYAEENIYWLTILKSEPGSLPMMDTLTAGFLPADFSDRYEIRKLFSEKQVFSPLISDDPWYWLSIFAPNNQSLDLDLGNVASGDAALKITLWGATEAPTENDHHLKVWINGQLVLDEFWDGSGKKVLESAIESGVLKTGSNQITFDAPGDTGALADSLFIQAIEFTYFQETSTQDQFTLIGEGKAVALKKRSETPDIFDISKPHQPIRLIPDQQSDGEGVFMAENDHQYLVVYGQSEWVPEVELPSKIPPELLSDIGADYVVVGSPELLEPLRPLMDYRQGQGLSTMVLPVEAVYDRFNHGLPEPVAIHAMLQHAFASWQTKPRYLLLIGDASYDPKGYLGNTPDKSIPIHFVETLYGGVTGSDLPYVDINEDGRPDLAVGRLPANTAIEVADWVEKTIAYEQALPDNGSFGILAVADGQEVSFSSDAQSFLDHFAESYPVELFSPQTGADDAASQIVNHFRKGYHIIGYFGHGSLNMWGQDKLLTVEDVKTLNNSQLPLVITMTCLNGFFFHPTNTSLAEALILAPDAGAAAVLAPTSLTLVWDQMFLGKVLYPALADPGAHRLGDVLLQAQRSMPLETQGQRDVLLTFLLFGDPALRLRIQ